MKLPDVGFYQASCVYFLHSRNWTLLRFELWHSVKERYVQQTNAWLNEVTISEFFAVLSDTTCMDCCAVNRSSFSRRVLSVTYTQASVISGRRQLPAFWVRINNEVHKTENRGTRIILNKLKTCTHWGTSAKLNGVSRFKLPVRGKSSQLFFFFSSLRRLMWIYVESNCEKYLIPG